MKKPTFLAKGLGWNSTELVVKMLDISTAHITKEVSEWLDQQAIDYQAINDPNAEELPEEPPCLHIWDKPTYGWFIRLIDRAEMDEGGFNRMPENIEAVLGPVIKYATELGCAWLSFDMDGETMAHLPTYDW